MGSGPIVIGYDGTEASDHAIAEAGRLLEGRPALVVVVYKQGLGFEAAELPTVTMGFPPAPLDVRTALEIDAAIYEGAQRMAQQGAERAMDAGFEAEGLAVADDVEIPVAETLVKVASERDAPAIVVGAHGHGRLSTVVLGSTSRDVIRKASCPVVVVRQS